MDEYWDRIERMHQVTKKKKMQKCSERMQFDREIMHDFFGMMQEFRE